MSNRLTRDEILAEQEYLAACDRIRHATELDLPEETEQAKQSRIDNLKNNFNSFCKYYFKSFMDSEFGWFHKKAAREVQKDKNIFAILEWPREHAKSVYATIMLPMYLYARGELTGMILASANEEKATTLLRDLQIQFEANQRWINDFGQIRALTGWKAKHFQTKTGIGFWAFGRGQSPRGVRVGANRPNLGVIDDLDDAVLVRNRKRVQDAVQWCLEDFFGALTIGNARLIVAGNRIHKYSILAHLVGDVEPKDPKRPGVCHIKVYATENSRHGLAELENPKSRCAWKERYTKEDFKLKRKTMGFHSFMREFYHKHYELGIVFKPEDIHWNKMINWDWSKSKILNILKTYDTLIQYCDPSYKDTKNSDFKATVLIGKKNIQYHVLTCWIRQSTTTRMVQAMYDIHEKSQEMARTYIEANFLQDNFMLWNEFKLEGEHREYQLRVTADKRKKPNKQQRIESLQPFAERAMLIFNEYERDNPYMQVLVSQFLGFPYSKDDGPDAVEGGISLADKRNRSSNFRPIMGKYKAPRI